MQSGVYCTTQEYSQYLVIIVKGKQSLKQYKNFKTEGTREKEMLLLSSWFHVSEGNQVAKQNRFLNDEMDCVELGLFLFLSSGSCKENSVYLFCYQTGKQIGKR